MTVGIRLALVLHNHQPVGNFDGVFEAAYQDSYAPFLDVLDEFPEISISLHTSGSLLEWIVDAHPEYIDRLRTLIERGQIEIVGGPFYEPILAGIPRRDRIGQIIAYGDYLDNLFGSRARGMWVPERVWEPSFAADVAEAGIEYTVLDDYHFRNAGLREDQLHGYYLCEDEGRLLKIFPGSERLRYTIPFQEPQATIDYLRGIAETAPGTIVTFGDDGEKFGTWPGTKKHVYEEGWLRNFLNTLCDNRDWLQVVTLADAVDNVSPLGTCYLPDCSYREMTEWALPTERQSQYLELTHRLEDSPEWRGALDFIKGGFWRNFRVKYPEANEMYVRMLELSGRLDEMLQADNSPEQLEALQQAKQELYRGQCNCAYWHGAFGGLYLPHLRDAIYRHLIAADTALEVAAQRTNRWTQIDAADFNFDARKEIRIAGERLVAYLAPSRGGHLYELDIRNTRHNLLATLNRRPEPYHQKVREVGQRQRDGGDDNENNVASIHDMVRFKQPDLDKKLTYDNWPRKALVDHFLQPGLSLESFQAGGGELGDFVTGVYESRLRRSAEWVEASMTRDGNVGPYHHVRVEKTVRLDSSRAGQLKIVYQLSNLPLNVPLHFGVEFNFAGMAANNDDRYYYDAEGRQLGQLETVQALEETTRIGLVDEWLGVDVAVESSQPAGFWAFPIQTVSQSEGGFELVHQSCMVMPHWEFTAPADGKWTVELQLAVDTSAAQARKLREPATVG
jgi:alpha-amylase